MRFSFFIVFLFSSCTYNDLVPVCEPNRQDFFDLVQPIIEANCVGCHNEYSGRPAILTTYDGVIDAVNIHALKHEIISGQMPPYGSSPLTSSEISIIENWIDCE